MDKKVIGDPIAHYWRMIRMADAVGISPVEAWKAGKLSSEAHAGMVERCQQCPAPGACGRLLETRPELDQAPEYCQNRAFFAGMKAEGLG